jgi:hypothetical protein
MSETGSPEHYGRHARHRKAGFRAARGIATAAMVLISLCTVLQVLLVARTWQFYFQSTDLLSRAGPSASQVNAANGSVRDVSVLVAAAVVVTAVVFLVWLARARTNAELIAGPASQRLSRGWTIGGWFCPVVNLWFPYRIMSDIYRASSPRTDVSGAVVGLWWAAILVDVVLRLVVFLGFGTMTADNVPVVITLVTAGLLCGLAATNLIVLVMARIRIWQEPAPAGRGSG